MNYYFDNFVFDSQSLILTQNGESLTIRPNESRLLAYFLENPQAVLSKDAILEKVWAGKVVSEQAVFQAISNLRALFGEDALKTYPKKGYQWQIPLQADSAVIAGENAVQPQASSGFLSNRFVALIILGCVVGVLVFWTMFKTFVPQQDEISIIVHPFIIDANHTGNDQLAQEVQDNLFAQLDNQQAFQLHLPLSTYQQSFSPQQVMASPAHFFNLYQQSIPARLLVTARVRQQGDDYYLSFTLQGRENKWVGYLNGKNLQDLSSQLSVLLKRVAPVKPLWETEDRRLVNAQLQVLQNENPDDLVIHYQLIDNLLLLGDFHTAKMQSDNLLQKAINQKNLSYQLLALTMQVLANYDTVYPNNNLTLLKQITDLAETFNDPLLLSRILEQTPFIFYQLQSFEALEPHLLRALKLAEVVNAPEQQIEVLEGLTIFSYKFKRDQKRDEYLAAAKLVLDKYQFPSESYAMLENISGIYSDDQHQKETFFRQALSRFKPEQESRVKESAQESLVNLYINQARWLDALELFANEPQLSGAELLFKARVYFKQQQNELAIEHAEAAFKLASLQGKSWASIEAALLLAGLYQQSNQPELKNNMLDYINKHASSSWRRNRKDILLALANSPT